MVQLFPKHKDYAEKTLLPTVDKWRDFGTTWKLHFEIKYSNLAELWHRTIKGRYPKPIDLLDIPNALRQCSESRRINYSRSRRFAVHEKKQDDISSMLQTKGIGPTIKSMEQKLTLESYKLCLGAIADS